MLPEGHGPPQARLFGCIQNGLISLLLLLFGGGFSIGTGAKLSFKRLKTGAPRVNWRQYGLYLVGMGASDGVGFDVDFHDRALYANGTLACSKLAPPSALAE